MKIDELIENEQLPTALKAEDLRVSQEEKRAKNDRENVRIQKARRTIANAELAKRKANQISPEQKP
jgi:hypothetical protein